MVILKCITQWLVKNHFHRNYLLQSLMAVVCSLSFLGLANAQPYGPYDMSKMLVVKKVDSKEVKQMDVAYLDKVLHDLAVHAWDYPTRFDTPTDKQRATKDAVILSKMLDLLTQNKNASPKLLRRSTLLHHVAHNLDVPEAAKKADRDYQRLIKLVPKDAQANYAYGVFLGGSNHAKESVPYLNKAMKLGHPKAEFSIGIAYLVQGNKDKALKHLKHYKKKHPDDKQVEGLITAIKKGQVELKTQ